MGVSNTEIKNSFNYIEYRNLMIRCSESDSTTGNEQLPERISATKINAHRMLRIEKQVQLSDELLKVIAKIQRRLVWIVLAESWCGDGAQNIPIIAKIAGAADIKLKIILRDEHPEVMDKYLTNGSRSIPKLVCLDAVTMEEIGTWGPRPAAIQQMVGVFKTHNPGTTHEQFVTNLHLWYAKDKGVALQQEFQLLLTRWMK